MKKNFRGGLDKPKRTGYNGGNKGEIGSLGQPGKPGRRMTMTLTILDDTGNYREIDLAAKKIFAGGLTNPSAWDTMAATKAR